MDKNLLVLLLIIPIAIIGGDSYLNAKKRKTDIMTMEAAIKQVNDKIGEANAAKQKIPDEREALTKLKSNYQIVMRALPKQEEAEGLLKQTIPIADKWIQFTELSPVSKKRESMTVTTSAGKPAVAYDQVSMKMVIRSSFAKLGRYFQEIENIRIMDARKLVEVSELDVKVEPKSDLLQVTMEVKSYIIPE